MDEAAHPATLYILGVKVKLPNGAGSELAPKRVPWGAAGYSCSALPFYLAVLVCSTGLGLRPLGRVVISIGSGDIRWGCMLKSEGESPILWRRDDTGDRASTHALQMVRP